MEHGFSGLPAEWDVNVTCGWQNGPWEVHPPSTNGSATCSFPMAPVAPGLHKAWMRVEVRGPLPPHGALPSFVGTRR